MAYLKTSKFNRTIQDINQEVAVLKYNSEAEFNERMRKIDMLLLNEKEPIIGMDFGIEGSFDYSVFYGRQIIYPDLAAKICSI